MVSWKLEHAISFYFDTLDIIHNNNNLFSVGFFTHNSSVMQNKVDAIFPINASFGKN